MLSTIAALIFAVAAQDADAFDDANLALTACSFEALREAGRENLSPEQFDRALQSRCAVHRAKARALFIEARAARGSSRAAAAREADLLFARQRTSFLGQHARRAETAAQLKQLEQALEEQAKQ